MVSGLLLYRFYDIISLAFSYLDLRSSYFRSTIKTKKTHFCFVLSSLFRTFATKF